MARDIDCDTNSGDNYWKVIRETSEIRGHTLTFALLDNQAQNLALERGEDVNPSCRLTTAFRAGCVQYRSEQHVAVHSGSERVT